VPEGAESRIRTGALIAAAGGALLILSLFLDWYEFKAPGGGGRSVSASGWKALERTDIYLLVLAILALLAVVVLVADWVKDSNAAQLTVAVLGVFALFLVIYRGTSPPAPVVFGVKLDTSLKYGWFLALLSSAAITAGGAMAVVRRPRPEGAVDEAEGAVDEVEGEPAPPAAQSPPPNASPAPPPDA
jgi:hypothetical protein